MINRWVGVGRLTKDPSLSYTQTGVAVCRFTVACNRPFKNEGEQQADFIQCVAWRKVAENTANFLRKGSLVGIDGRISTGSYEGQDGKRIFTTEITAESVQFLDPKNSSSNQSNSGQAAGYTNTPNYQQNTQNQPATTYDDPFSPGAGPIAVDDSDLPF